MKRLSSLILLLLILLSACRRTAMYGASSGPADDSTNLGIAPLPPASCHMRDLPEFLAWAAVAETKETETTGFADLLERIRAEEGVIAPLYNREDVITAFENVTEEGKAGAMAISALPQEPGYQYTVLIEGKRMLVRVCFMKPAYAENSYGCYLDYCADTIGKEEHDEPDLAQIQKYRPTVTEYYESKLKCGGTERECLITKTDIDTTVVYLMNPYYIWISGEPMDMEAFMGKMDVLTFEKQSLPDLKEATLYLAERTRLDEEYAALTGDAGAVEQTESGPPKAEKFVLSQCELLEFLTTVDVKTYPAEGSRGQGLLSSLVEAIRADGYLLMPHTDGAPTAFEKGIYCSLTSNAGDNMSGYFVEAYHASHATYYGLVRYPTTAEDAALLAQGVEAFKQSKDAFVNLENWKDCKFIKDYREVTFTLNGEEQTGFTTVHDSYTRLEFIYEGKLIALTCYEEGADSFDLSVFEHMTLEKVSLPE